MSVPAERLAAADLYHYLDWLREAFEAGDELLEVEERDPVTGRRRLRLVFQRDRQLERLERVLAHVGEPFRGEMLGLVGELKRARLAAGVPDATLERFFRLVTRWDRARPRLVCDRCELRLRGRQTLAEHRRVVHGLEVEV